MRKERKEIEKGVWATVEVCPQCKDVILKKMVALENTSEILAYGAPKPKEKIYL